MILLKMEQEIIDFIGDNKYVESQCRLMNLMCLGLLYGFNHSFWKDLGVDKTLFNMFADSLNRDAIGVRSYVLMGIVAWTMCTPAC